MRISEREREKEKVRERESRHGEIINVREGGNMRETCNNQLLIGIGKIRISHLLRTNARTHVCVRTCLARGESGSTLYS
jgi:hypothetical protein